MKKLFSFIIISLMIVGCSTKGNEVVSDKPLVVTTNSIIADMVENVAKDKVDVYSIVPIGVDPHEYEPLPKDLEKVIKADIIFYNGLNLETGSNNWFDRLMNETNKEVNKDYFIVSEDVKAMYLSNSNDKSKQDPHAWLDLKNGISYINSIEKTLSNKDKENAAFYKKNTQEYVNKLDELDKYAKEAFKDIPQEKRLLVSSEGAFKYFGKAYGLDTAFIWEINTEKQGTPDQMKQILKRINESKVSSLFIETSIDPRSMEQVSNETKVPIHGKIFTDSLAKKGEQGDNYYDMIKWNIETIHKGLSK